MIYGSVCSGIEAATVAWHPLGWTPAFFSEIDRFPRSCLEYHYPDTPVHGDFTTIGEKDYGSIELLVGGTPCQSFSIAGLRKGMGDDRGNLALEFLKLAKRKRPRWLVWENVPGVLSSNGGRDFGSFLGGLGELGYGWAYRVLDAQYFGVAQRRRRVFVVGYLGDWRPPAAVLFERESMSGNPAPSRERGEGTATDAAKSVRTHSGGIDREDMHTLLPCDPGTAARVAGSLDVSSVNYEARLAPNGTMELRPVVGTIKSNAHKGRIVVMSSGQANAEITENLTPALNCNRDGAPIAFQSNANAGDAPAAGDNISPTVRGGGGGNPPAVAFAQNQRDEVRVMDEAGLCGRARYKATDLYQAGYGSTPPNPHRV